MASPVRLAMVAAALMLVLTSACGLDEYYTNIGTGAVAGDPLYPDDDDDPVVCTCNCEGGGNPTEDFKGLSWVMDSLLLGEPLVNFKSLVNDTIETEMGKGTINVLMTAEDDNRETGILSMRFGVGDKGESSYTYKDGSSVVEASLTASSGAFTFNETVGSFVVTIPMEGSDPISIPIKDVTLTGVIAADGSKISDGTLVGLLTVTDAQATYVLIGTLYDILTTSEGVQPDNDMDGDSVMDSWVFEGSWTATSCTASVPAAAE